MPAPSTPPDPPSSLCAPCDGAEAGAGAGAGRDEPSPPPLTDADWATLRDVSFVRKGVLIAKSDDNAHVLARLRAKLTYEYGETYGERRARSGNQPQWLQKAARDARPAPLACYRESATHLLVPKFWALHALAGAGVLERARNDNAAGDAMRDGAARFAGALRETQRSPQQSATAYALEHLRRTGGTLLQSPVGSGKTVMACYIAAQLGVKTLVCVANEGLADQWAARVRAFLPDARVGRVQGPRCDIDECDVVVGMVQSLSMHTYDAALVRRIGLVIFDEAHHAAAPSFVRAVWQVAAPYMLALTQDPSRTDGMTRVLYHFFSYNVYIVRPSLPDGLTLHVVVHHIERHSDRLEPGMRAPRESASARRQRLAAAAPTSAAAARRTFAGGGAAGTVNDNDDGASGAKTRKAKETKQQQQQRSARVSDDGRRDDVSVRGYMPMCAALARLACRNELIVAVIKRVLASRTLDEAMQAPDAAELAATTMPAHYNEPQRTDVATGAGGAQCERHVLVLCNTKEHIRALRKRLVRSGLPKAAVGVYWGECTSRTRDAELRKRVVLATYGMAAEGLDSATFNAIVFASPRSRTTDQAVGRIIRDRLRAEWPPLVVDVRDAWCSMADAMYWARTRTYNVYPRRYTVRTHDFFASGGGGDNL